MPESIEFYLRNEPYGWLSNFSDHTIIINGQSYATVEHWYQSHKPIDAKTQAWVAQAPTPWLAMKAGKSLRPHEVTPEWAPENRLRIMHEGVMAKFSQHQDLAQQLLATGDAILHEAPKDGWSDSFWGNSPQPDGSPGESHLGRILMDVRAQLRGSIPD